MPDAATEPWLVDGPERAPTIVLAHGAGVAMDSDFMNAMAEGMARHGLRVVQRSGRTLAQNLAQAVERAAVFIDSLGG